MTTKKITLATVKSFIKKNSDNLFINIRSKFDGMTDGIQQIGNEFTKTQKDENLYSQNNTLGIKGAWFVGSSNDFFTSFEDDKFIGIEVYNCCGKFILAISK
jgi:hypothetical protein